MILILMQGRSGSSLVASIFAAHGFDTKHSEDENQFGYKNWEHEPVKGWLYPRKDEMDYQNGQFCAPLTGVESVFEEGDCAKIGIEYWPCFQHLPVKVFCVRRHPEQIAKSLVEKRTKINRMRQSPREMWSMVCMREKMMDRARNESGGVDVDVDKIVGGDFSQLRSAFEHHGLEFDESKARACVKPEKFKWR